MSRGEMARNLNDKALRREIDPPPEDAQIDETTEREKQSATADHFL